ncbi:MAG: DUF362 domain-containing protein [Phycisphaerae bacterium]|nr:DUF362 domain-containing protein [Phycisphaerae bacterium]
MHRLSRRQLFRRAADAGLTLGAAGSFLGCQSPTIPFVPSPDDIPFEEASRVVAVRGTDLYEMTQQVIAAVGGIERIVQPGETVFVKPNFGGLGFVDCNVFTSGESTKVEIVLAVIEECLRAGASEVIVGEGGQVRDIPWDKAVTLDGSTTLPREIGSMNEQYAGKARLVSLETGSPAFDPLPSPHTDLGSIYVSSLLARADRVISIAVPKTHRWTAITGSMKNFFGTTPFGIYGKGMGWRYMLHEAAGGPAQCFLDIVRAVQPDLAIIDGSICCQGNGPHVMPGWWGETIDISDHLGDWFLLASTDPAAADATAARIIGLDVERIPHLVRAREQGVGQTQEDRIAIEGASLDELRVNFKPADLTVGFNEVLWPGFMLEYFSRWHCSPGT